MLITKGNISRNIDEKRLARYKAQGFSPVEKSAQKPQAPSVQKPVKGK